MPASSSNAPDPGDAEATASGKATAANDNPQTGDPKGGAWRRGIEATCKRYDLSPRQCEILELLAKGRDAKFIEDHFCISKSTAKTHIYNIYCKMDIHSRQELIDIIESAVDDQ